MNLRRVTDENLRERLLGLQNEDQHLIDQIEEGVRKQLGFTDLMLLAQSRDRVGKRIKAYYAEWERRGYSADELLG